MHSLLDDDLRLSNEESVITPQLLLLEARWVAFGFLFFHDGVNRLELRGSVL